jgi:hypothetical protein
MDSLINNKRYIISFYVSLADYAYYTVSNVGAFISEDSINSTGCCVLLYPPQVYSDSTVQLTDENIWTKISGSFISNGREKYITIGNFRDDAHTDTMYVGGTSGWPAAYYYLDDVSVELDTTQGVGDMAINKPEILIYPQPARDKLTISNCAQAKQTLVSIFNMQGQQMISAQFQDQNTIELDVNALVKGIYLLKIQSENDVVNRKLLIQ